MLSQQQQLAAAGEDDLLVAAPWIVLVCSPAALQPPPAASDGNEEPRMESASAVNCCTQRKAWRDPPQPLLCSALLSSFFAVDAPPSCVALFLQVTQLKGDLRGEGPFAVLVQLLNSE